MTKIRDITWKEFEDYCVKNSCIAILPIGSIEQHGEHLPLGTDLIIAEKLAELVAKRAWEEGIRVLVLEPIPVTISREWSKNPGTLWVPGEVFQAYLKNYIHSVFRNGIKRLVVLNAHGGNIENIAAALKNAVYDFEESGYRIYLINWWELIGDNLNNIFSTPYFHADEIETSLALALGFGHKVSEPGEEIFRLYHSEWFPNDLRKRPRIYIFQREDKRREKGSFGRPDLASMEKGLLLLDLLIKRFIEFLKEVNSGRI